MKKQKLSITLSALLCLVFLIMPFEVFAKDNIIATAEPISFGEEIPTTANDILQTEMPRTYEATTVPVETENTESGAETSFPTQVADETSELATEKSESKATKKAKDLNSTGADISVSSTGAETADAKDIYLASGSRVSATVSIASNRVEITAGAITCTWTSTSSDNSTGTLTISRTSTGTIPEYYFGSKNNANGSAQNKSWAPWNGMAKWGSYTTYHSYLPTSKITKVVFDSTTTSVSTNAFRGSSALTSVDFGSSFQVIGKAAFAGTTSLTALTFTSATPLRTISDDAFRGCTALVSSKVGTPSDSIFYGLKTAINATNASNDKLNANTNVFTIPYTVTNIGEGAFWNCYSLRAVTWSRYETSISTIKHGSFVNCIGLQMFIIPKSVKKIDGYERKSDANNNEGKYAAFYVGDSVFSDSPSVVSSYKRYNLYLGIENTVANTNLTTIADGAFERAQVVKDASNNEVGIKLAIINTTNTSNSTIIGTNDTMVMPKLTYLGNKAFYNSSSLTGIIKFDSNINLGSRAFVGTNLTDIYFKWSGDSANSSTIGTSNQFISSSTSQGYSDSTHTPPSGYYSLYTLLNSSDNETYDSTTAGLKARWTRAFRDLKTSSTSYNTWSLFTGENLFDNDPNEAYYLTSSVLPLYAVPYTSYGNRNGSSIYSDSSMSNNVSYLRSSVRWTGESKAEETVTFGYKAKQGTDFVFIVDNSPSMDVATKNDLTNADEVENKSPLTGTYNVSKALTAYTQIYSLSKELLSNNNSASNSVTVLSFWGKNDNSLNGSAKSLGFNMTSIDTVNTALYGNDNHHEEGVSTNYSSGLSLAYHYLTLPDLKNNGKNKIVIMISDGAPSIAGLQNSSSVSDNTFSKHQINGVDWAAAIRNDKEIDTKLTADNANETGVTIYNSSTDKFKVHSFSNSSYDAETGKGNKVYDFVDGLGYPIYSITIGNNSISAASKRAANGSSLTSTRAYAAAESAQIAKKLKDIANSAMSQNYKIVVPIDNNFIVDTAVSQEMCLDKVSLSATADVSAHDLNSSISSYDNLELTNNTNLYSLNAGTEVSLEGACLINRQRYYYNFGSLKYDSSANCLILSLNRSGIGNATNLEDDILFENGSHAFWEYELNIPLKYVGNGVIVNTSSYSVTQNSTTKYIRPMVAVNNARSKKLVSNPDSSYYKASQFTGTISTSSLGNYNVSTGSKISGIGGAYAAVYDDTWEQFNIINIADPIYLPLQDIKTTKYKKDTSTVLNGAEFKVYTDRAADGTCEQVFFSANGSSGGYTNYCYNQSGSVDVISGNSVITLLPAGTYYFSEVTAPNDETDYKYNIGTDIVNDDSAPVAYVKKVIIDDINPIYTTNSGSSTQYEDISIYNTPIAKGSTTVTGKKVDPSGNPVQGARIALYKTQSDWVNDENRVAVATSATDGTFSFTITQSMGTGRYYWREIDVPSGYAKIAYYEENASASRFSVSTISEGTTVNMGNIYNSPTTNIYVHVNSSDAVKNDFNFTLTSNTSIAPYGNVTYINGETLYGTSDSSGTYVFENVPVYTATFNYGQFWFGKFSYSIKENSVPSRYITPEYGTSFESATARTGVYSMGTLTERENKVVYVYNPSIRITLHNYESDGLTPLCSLIDFDGTVVTTDNSLDATYWTGTSDTGSVEIDGWYGYTSDIPLVQTRVQDGYSLLADAQSITMDSSSTYETAYTPTGLKYYKYDYTILNSPKTQLPYAGGHINDLLYLLLAMAVLLNVTAICIRKRETKKHKQ